jgi:hypothetical protein
MRPGADIEVLRPLELREALVQGKARLLDTLHGQLSAVFGRRVVA